MSNFILSLFIHHPCLVLEPDRVTPGGVRGFHSPVSLLHQALQFKVPTVVSQWSLQRLFPSDRTLSQGLAALCKDVSASQTHPQPYSPSASPWTQPSPSEWPEVPFYTSILPQQPNAKNTKNLIWMDFIEIYLSTDNQLVISSVLTK